MQKSTSLILGFLALASITLYLHSIKAEESPLSTEFQEFKATHHRDYSPVENAYRLRVFEENLMKIRQHNADSTQTYETAVNQFTDLTQQEFVERYLMKNLEKHIPKDISVADISQDIKLSGVDWRSKGVLTPVKNQGSCGSCWAFSTTGVLESRLAVAGKGLNSFSEQQLVDCCGRKGYQCQGCSGAWPEWALNYINVEGIVKESEYSYTARVGTCKNVPTAVHYLNRSKPWSMVSSISSIQSSLMASGPVSICVDATYWSSYSKGVFNRCNSTPLNHAVLAVGFTSDNVWIVKNSWGTSWGQDGFIYLAAGNTCGLGDHALIPNLA